MAEVFILLGGNVGDKSKLFNKTRKLIGERIGKITKLSSVYVTESWGFESELFWNQAIIVSAILEPQQLLLQTQAIERDLGRTNKGVNYEARTMDIDLIFYDDLQINTPELTLPHPRLAERKFVLVPLNEIAPQKRHPHTGMTVWEMLKNCTDPLRVDRL